jgi:hypothetical protein
VCAAALDAGGVLGQAVPPVGVSGARVGQQMVEGALVGVQGPAGAVEVPPRHTVPALHCGVVEVTVEVEQTRLAGVGFEGGGPPCRLFLREQCAQRGDAGA